jgi:hypothetical protein
MKYILSILFIILSFSAFSQTRFPSVDSAKNYVLRYVKNSAVESFTNWRMQNVNYGTLELLDSLAGNGAIDSIWKSGDTLKYSKNGVNYTIGTVGGSNPTLQQVTTVGNSTTDSLNVKTPLNKLAVSITSADFSGAENTSGEIKLINTFDNSYLFLNELGLSSYSSGSALAKELRFTSNRNQYSQISIPDSSGTLTQRITLNGTTYNTASNGVVSLGNTDTATVVKAYVTNAEAVTITKGQVVYIFGASGDRASVKLAKNTSDTFSSKTLGIVRADIAAGQAGWITTQGQVSGINLGAYTAGDILWLDSVPGGFTKVRPQAPLHGVFVGVVERANSGNGLIYVKPANGLELEELHDVALTTKLNNQVLAYTASTGVWQNKTVDSSFFGGQFAAQVTSAQSKVIQWSGADSLYSHNQLKKGMFRTYDFDGLSGVSGIPQGSGDCFGMTTISSNGTFANLLENNTFGISISTGGSAVSNPYISQGWANSTNVTYNVTGPNIQSTWMHFRVKIPTLNDGTQKFYVVVGFKNVATANPTESAYFTYDLDGTQTGSTASSSWQCVSALGGNREWSTTSSTVPVDTWQTLSIRTTETAVDFYINGVLVETHNTRIPAAGRIYLQIFKTNGSTARFLHVDYATFNQLNKTDR